MDLLMNAQLCYTIRHRTVPLIFPLVLQIITTAQMLSSAEQEG